MGGCLLASHAATGLCNTTHRLCPDDDPRHHQTGCTSARSFESHAALSDLADSFAGLCVGMAEIGASA